MQHNQEIYEVLLALPNKPKLTGSFIINPDKANDIDVLLLWDEELHSKLFALGFNQGWGSYKESTSSHTLKSTWRKENYNILVCKDIVSYTLWEAFTNIISNEDYVLENKSDRIKLHETITSTYKEIN